MAGSLQLIIPKLADFSHSLCKAESNDTTVSFPRGRIQEINVARASRARFIFNLNTEILSFTDYILQYLHVVFARCFKRTAVQVCTVNIMCLTSRNVMYSRKSATISCVQGI
jgi:hypothetical protein